MSEKAFDLILKKTSLVRNTRNLPMHERVAVTMKINELQLKKLNLRNNSNTDENL